MLASTRERQSSLARMFRTCMSIVRGLRASRPAISRFVAPSAAIRATSNCWAVSASTGLVDARVVDEARAYLDSPLLAEVGPGMALAWGRRED